MQILAKLLIGGLLLVGSLGLREQECKGGVEIVAFVDDAYKVDFLGDSHKVKEQDYTPPAGSEYDIYLHKPSNTVQLFYKHTGELVNCSKHVKYNWVWNPEEKCRFYYDVETKEICKESAEKLDAELAGDAEAELGLFSGSILFVSDDEESAFVFNERGRNLSIKVHRSETGQGVGSSANVQVQIGGNGVAVGQVENRVGTNFSSSTSQVSIETGRRMLRNK